MQSLEQLCNISAEIVTVCVMCWESWGERGFNPSLRVENSSVFTDDKCVCVLSRTHKKSAQESFLFESKFCLAWSTEIFTCIIHDQCQFNVIIKRKGVTWGLKPQHSPHLYQAVAQSNHMCRQTDVEKRADFMLMYKKHYPYFWKAPETEDMPWAL